MNDIAFCALLSRYGNANAKRYYERCVAIAANYPE